MKCIWRAKERSEARVPFRWAWSLLAVGVFAFSVQAQSPQPVASSADPSESGEANDRLAVPSKAQRAEAHEVILKLFASHFSKRDAAGKAELARLLLAQAKETNDDNAAQYELFVMSFESAVEAPDMSLAVESVEALARRFDVPLQRLKQHLLEQVVLKIRDREQAVQVVAFAQTLAEAAMQEDRYEDANDALDSALILARRARDATLVQRLAAHKRTIEKIRKQFDDTRDAFEKLESQPRDALANQEAGEFLCFAKGDFQSGLTYLALGADANLRSAAADELRNPDDATHQIQLADTWWDLADGRASWEADQIRAHAAQWYRAALPELQGLTETRVRARLAKVQPSAAESASDAGPGGAAEIEQRTQQQAMAHTWTLKMRTKTYTGVQFGKDGAYYLGKQPRSHFRWKVRENMVYLEPQIDQPLALFQFLFQPDGSVLVRQTKEGAIIDEGIAVPEP
ncbi:MAG: hypothetical protein KDA42_02000 [Planctomycetales bacterium]|nr:hypothetical protein [Planctomycetales bacterium]